MVTRHYVRFGFTVVPTLLDDLTMATRPSAAFPTQVPVWLPIAASLPVGLCMVVLTLPSIDEDISVARRLICLGLYLVLCLPLLFLQRAMWRRAWGWLKMVACLLLMSYVLSIFSNLADFTIARAAGWIQYQPYTLGKFIRGIDAFWLALVAFCAMHAVVCYYAELSSEKARSAEAKALLREAELRALRYQLSPHFLFNTLNGISTLIDSPRRDLAKQMIVQLADFLRATLDDRVQHEVRVADEIALTETYLSIERLRLGDKLKLRWDVGRDVLDKRVPYLLLQPIVENAIRHGIAMRSQPGRLEISIHRNRTSLLVRIFNEGVPPTAAEPQRGGMVGLQNISERLEKLYGDDCSFVASPDGTDGYCVEISLPVLEMALPKSPADVRPPLVDARSASRSDDADQSQQT